MSEADAIPIVDFVARLTVWLTLLKRERSVHD